MRVTPLAAGKGGELLVVPVFSFKPENTIFRRASAAAMKSRRPFLVVCPPKFTGEPGKLGHLGRTVRLEDAVLAVSEALQV